MTQPKTPLELELDAYRAALLEPARPQLRAARAAVAGARDPAVAWAQLGPIVGGAVGRDARRMFGVFCDVCTLYGEAGNEGAGRCAGCGDSLGGAREVPPTVSAALTLASDPEGLLTAEVLGREVAERLEPWGFEAPARVVWWVVPRDQVGGLFQARSSVEPYVFETVEDVARTSADALSIASESPRLAALLRRAERDWRSVRMLAWHDAARAVAWDHLACRGEIMRCGPHEGAPFAAFPNPFTPIAEIWRHGYMLVRLTAAGIVLGARRAPSREPARRSR